MPLTRAFVPLAGCDQLHTCEVGTSLPGKPQVAAIRGQPGWVDQGGWAGNGFLGSTTASDV